MQLIKFSVAAFWATLHYVRYGCATDHPKFAFKHLTFCQLKVFKKRISVVNIVFVCGFSSSIFRIDWTSDNRILILKCPNTLYTYFGQEFHLCYQNIFWYANAIKLCIVSSWETLPSMYLCIPFFCSQ